VRIFYPSIPSTCDMAFEDHLGASENRISATENSVFFMVMFSR